MKTTLLTIVALAISLSSFGQAPEAFKYQAVVRDAGGVILTNQSVGYQLAILQGSPSGTAVYTETFSPTTNGYGLVNLEIGTGTTADDFTIIDWGNGLYFMETSTDVTGGTSYVVMGTSQLMSVPFALHAKNSDGWTTKIDTVSTTKYVTIGTESPAFNGAGVTSQISDVTISSDFAVPLTLQRPSGVNTSLSVQNQVDTAFFGINQYGNASIGHNNDQSSAGIQLTPTGNVGIGTSNPQGQFEIYDGIALDTTKFILRSVHNDPVMIWMGELAASAVGGRGTTLINEGGNFSGGWNGFKIISGGAFDGSVAGVEALLIPNIGAESGYVGVGIDPQRPLHISDAMRLEPRATAPSTPSEGDIYMDSTTHKLMVYDGTIWQACW